MSMAIPGQLFPPMKLTASAIPSSAGLIEHSHELLTTDRAYAEYPPVVIESQILGYLRDVNGCEYSRDIGRSSTVKGKIFYQFGDTFCKNRHGAYVGVTSHTCSRVNMLDHPQLSQYTKINPKGKVESFLPLSDSEKKFDADESEHGGRTTLWSFGGILADGPVADRGWCWFEKGVACKNGNMIPLGTGVARVIYEKGGNIFAQRKSDSVLFSVDEPRWGTFSTLRENGFNYLWGHHNEGVYLARVKCLSALDRSMYEYWDGSTYTSDWESSVPVFKNLQHGAIYPTKLFAPEHNINYVFIGVSSFADSCIIMGCAETLEGPYETFTIAKASGINGDGYMYCIYPHPWAFKEEDGELMVTWSEKWPGGVVAAKLKFKQCLAHRRTHKKCHKLVFTNDYPHAVSSRISSAGELVGIQRYTRTRIVEAGRYVAEGMALSPATGLPLHQLITGMNCEKVEEAALLLTRVIDRLTREWLDKVEEERQRQARESQELRERFSRGRRLSDTIRNFFSRRRRSSTYVVD